LIYLVLLVTVILLVINLIALINAITFPRLGKNRRNGVKNQDSVDEGRLVSVLIPARDEAANIATSVAKILAQEGVNLELVILDDHSTDGTAEVASQAARDERLRVLRGADLPTGWLGKNWACHQLSEASRGDILVFSDADVAWENHSLASLVGYLEKEQASMVTVWPTQITVTWAERLVVPLMALAVLGYLPVPAVHYLPFSSLAAANGQCLCFRRDDYQRIGGHAVVRDSIVEDISLAKRVKKRRGRLRMMDGAGEIRCRMYHSWTEVRQGYAKNILAGHGNSLVFLSISTVFHWLVFLAPWVWLAGGWLQPGWPGLPVDIDLTFAFWPLVPLALVLLGISARAITAAATRQRVRDAVWMPVSTLLMTVIAAQSAYWRLRFGGPLWKGRVAR